MDKVIKFFNSKGFRRGLSSLSVLYIAFLSWVAWLSMAYFLRFESKSDSASLFVIYLFINLVALVAMIFTRKVFATKLVALLAPPVVFAIVLLGFGNWYVIIPPLAVVFIAFVIVRVSENTKTVLGTVYVIMYFLGIVAYVVMGMFVIEPLTLSKVDLNYRDSDYTITSLDGEYRIVRYIDPESRQKRMIDYYIEKTEDDFKLPFSYAEKIMGSQWVFTRPYGAQVEVKWDDSGKLYVDDGSFTVIYSEIADKDGNFTLVNNLTPALNAEEEED